MLIALPLVLILILRGWLWIERKEGFPFDSFALIMGVAVVGTTININLLIIKLSFNLPLWFPCMLFLLLNFKHLDQYFISKKNVFTSMILGAILGLAYGTIIDILYFRETQSIAGSIWVWTYQIFNSMGEELLFRCIFLAVMIRVGIKPWGSVLIQSILFVLMHLDYFHTQNWLALMGVALVGVSAGWITVKYRNVAGPVFLHIMYNLSFLI